MENTILSVNAQLQNLEQLVLEKDQLLGMLTERLEQAAEQLDRFRREGTHPNYEQAPQADGIADNEPDLRNSLRQMLEDWHDLRERGWFEQLEQRLESIQDRSIGVSHSATNKQQITSTPLEAPSNPKPAHNDEQESYTSSVADILARYGMGEAKPPESDAKSQPELPPPIPVITESYSPSSSSSELISDRMLVSLPVAPEEIDIENADLQQLRDAVLARNEYISLLQEYLSTLESTAQEPVRIPALDMLTSDQKDLLENWSDAIRKEFRQTQIQISLERAQLSRETMKLQNQKQLIDREIKRMDLAKRAGLMNSGEGDEETGEISRSRSWLGLFGTK